MNVGYYTILRYINVYHVMLIIGRNMLILSILIERWSGRYMYKAKPRQLTVWKRQLLFDGPFIGGKQCTCMIKRLESSPQNNITPKRQPCPRHFPTFVTVHYYNIIDRIPEFLHSMLTCLWSGGSFHQCRSIWPGLSYRRVLMWMAEEATHCKKLWEL